MYRIQDIHIKPFVGNELITHMYYRGNSFIYKDEKDHSILKEESKYDFFTYFNSLSLEKWKKYTFAKYFYLVLDVKGKFELNIFGHYKNREAIEKEYLGHYLFNKGERSKIKISIPFTSKSQVLGFDIAIMEETTVYDAYYACDISDDNIHKTYIALTTTTFKKEEYIQNNIELLTKDIFENEEYSEHFCWNIIDNGKTLQEQKDTLKKIRIFHNKNVGGAGGFARGMIEGLTQSDNPTHILLMDDDVNFSTESFKRLYKLLSIIRPEYKDYFISGAMLKMNAPNIQHEDTGKLNKAGYHEATKPNLDLNLWNNVLINEQIDESEDNRYAAWWFCCIPVGIARLDNLPLPFFVRGDDVEYSLRNKAKFITMNGICIWHDGFEGKFSAALEFYQVERNELIVTALHKELAEIDVIGHIKEIFWQEIYKFNYKGASLLLDAIEDYLKGPDYFSSIDLFEKLQEKRKMDNQLITISEDVRKLINYEQLYAYTPIKSRTKFIYDYTYNGQARLPEIFIKKKIGVIPYGWGYFPGKQCMANKLYAIDLISDKYVIYKKNRQAFNTLKLRYKSIIKRYQEEKDVIIESYRNAELKLKSNEFWKNYLDI